MKPKKTEDDAAQQFNAALNDAFAERAMTAIMLDLEAKMKRAVRAAKRRKKA
jgi:hypothetical protein